MGQERHPPGLYVLFATEMWERFSFYSMLAMFVLYMEDGTEGFGWTKPEAISLYSNYMMFVYASPLIGGWLADRGLGYRRSVMIGGAFFMAGHLLLSIRTLTAVYAALTCLVIGNGFFKPNVSTMVGNLYREGSHLKDRAYNIFYMGINVGAFLAPLTAAVVQKYLGYHVAFAVAAFGMVISVTVLWTFRRYVEDPGGGALFKQQAETAAALGHFQPGARNDEEAAVTADVPPQSLVHEPTPPRPALPIDAVPDWMRVSALLVIFATVIVFWMVFHQNGSTITYWANENTDWQVSGIVANSINAGWVIVLTFPLVYFWKWLDSYGLEPSTPTKMACGMLLTGVSFFIFYWAAKVGEASAPPGQPNQFKVSPLWLVSAIAVVTLGELMLSPMGLSLVSKVAPLRWRGLMMGGWFVATAIGNKLTMIGVLWEQWLHSSFFALLGGLALAAAVLLLLLQRPLKKAMPGV